ncbi:hypothetical protein RIF29_22446 [Crotalaria pallida]|uniref:Reverse transcriptase zinc-binding domain-containing protein n=1 Tax=Crotalaria pallida TaxID=3830 RepID=A0AAN9F4M4_CROPI
MLYSVIPDEVKSLICSIPVPVFQSCPDQVIWGGNSNGLYSIADAYVWLGSIYKGWTVLTESANWVWKLHIPAKLQWFSWLMAHNALPTNLFRLNRGLCSSSACTRCSGGDESVLHVLRDCPHAREDRDSFAEAWPTVGGNALCRPV